MQHTHVLYKMIQRLRSPIHGAFSYKIQHISLWFSEIWPYAFESQWNMPYPVWKAPHTGLYNLCNITVHINGTNIKVHSQVTQYYEFEWYDIVHNKTLILITVRVFSLNFWWGRTQNFPSPSVPDGDKVDGGGGLVKNILLKPKLPT